MLKIVYAGSVADQKKNPVYALLLEYEKMRENEIISHINSWWYNVDGREIFDQSRDSGLITKMDGHWSLNHNIQETESAIGITTIGDTAQKRKKSLLALLSPWLALIGTAGLALLLAPKILSGKEPLKLMAVYHTTSGHVGSDICDKFDGGTFDLLNKFNRPVPPSEGLGYTTTHPNCHCTWEIIKEVTKQDRETKMTKPEKKHVKQIQKQIIKKAKSGELHTVKTDGSLVKRTRKSNPMRETIEEIREDFEWVNDDYLESALSLANTRGGQLYLIRAAEETITDHRSEGEQYRRSLDAYELHGMARTAIGKHADINHFGPSFQTELDIIDSEFDPKRKEIQMVVIEKDPEIINAIANGQISAVSINGGAPRTEIIAPCDPNCKNDQCEMCNHPRGVALGEVDNIGFTWVITDPQGMMWRGHKLPAAKPGIHTTGIQPI